MVPFEFIRHWCFEIRSDQQYDQRGLLGCPQPGSIDIDAVGAFLCENNNILQLPDAEIQTNEIATSSGRHEWETFLLSRYFPQTLNAIPSFLFHGLNLSLYRLELKASTWGVGVRLQPSENWLILIPIEQSPAAEAGIQVGDILLSVDDVDVGNSVEFASSLLQGQANSTVEVAILRGTSRYTVQVTRRRLVELNNIDYVVNQWDDTTLLVQSTFQLNPGHYCYVEVGLRRSWCFEVIASPPDTVNTYMVRAHYYITVFPSHDYYYQQAVQELSHAIELDPNYIESYMLRGVVYLRWIEDYNAAIADFTRIIELDPDNGEAYLNRSKAYSSLGNFEEAIADLNHVIEISPNNALGYQERASIYRSLGNYDAAIADYTHVIELDTNNESLRDYLYLTYADRGYTYYEAGDYDAAIADFNHVIELHPTDYYHYYQRGMIHQEIGDYEAAIADYTRAIELAENEGYLPFETYNVLGDLFYDLDRYDEALQQYRSYLQYNNNPEPYILERVTELEARVGSDTLTPNFSDSEVADTSAQLNPEGSSPISVAIGNDTLFVLGFTVLENIQEEAFVLSRQDIACLPFAVLQSNNPEWQRVIDTGDIICTDLSAAQAVVVTIGGRLVSGATVVGLVPVLLHPDRYIDRPFLDRINEIADSRILSCTFARIALDYQPSFCN